MTLMTNICSLSFIKQGAENMDAHYPGALIDIFDMISRYIHIQ